ncbi:ATP-binding cassette domain-containing protein [Desertihabitans brevis]|nr:ATP-binding cassette domain-containing protein [Desertihabitans brevis]
MSETVMRATGLVKEFGGGGLRRRRPFRAVDDVSFAIPRGQTLALVGESGSGKSTTARMAAHLVEPTAGRIELEGEDVTRLRAEALARFRSRVQVVFQDPFSSLNPRHSVEQIVTAPLRYQGRRVPGGERAFTRALMERVGLDPDHSRRLPRQFSGGQAQRIGIARALAVDPSVVICDEAVSALDVSVQAQVIELLVRLQAEQQLSYLFIAHDLAVVRQIAQQVAVMSQGRVVESGPREQVFDAPQHEYTRALLGAVPRIPAEWDAARRAMVEQQTVQEEMA